MQTEYVEILRISPYSVQLWENAGQKNSEYRHFLRSVILICETHWMKRVLIKSIDYPLDAGRNLNVHRRFIRRVLCTLNLRFVSNR